MTCFKRPSSSLIIAIPLCVSLSTKAHAEVYLDSIHFPSSLVRHDLDLTLDAKQSLEVIDRKHQDGFNILHSCIDRDLIHIKKDLQKHKLCETSIFSPQHQQWKSPLERIYPLQSWNPPFDTESKILDTPPAQIHDGPRHNHKITPPTQPQSQSLNLKVRKTGTTITALLACNSTVVILAADTRATDGTTVADSNCEKLHQLARNVWCAGAGTSGDVEAIVRSVKFAFWKRGVLNEVGNLGRSAVVQSMNFVQDGDNVPSASLPAILHCLRTQLQKTQGQLGVNLLVGGYDHHSQHATLAAIYPHGSMDIITYGALGSGGLAATGVLEMTYPKIGSGHCTLEEGIRLAVDAVRAGVENDLGSGSCVDVCIIAKEGVLYRRAVVKEEVLEWVDRNEANVLDRRVLGGGVNGFGNVPFSIQSEKIVVSGELLAEKARRQWLDTVLGNKEQ